MSCSPGGTNGCKGGSPAGKPWGQHRNKARCGCFVKPEGRGVVAAGGESARCEVVAGRAGQWCRKRGRKQCRGAVGAEVTAPTGRRNGVARGGTVVNRQAGGSVWGRGMVGMVVGAVVSVGQW